MDEKQKNTLEELLQLSRRDPDILAVLVFGSVARGEEMPHSDVDVCLLLSPAAEGSEPIALSRKRLEYLARFDLDVRVFQQLPLYIRRRVLREGRVLFARDEDLLYGLALRTAQAFEDFRPIYFGYLEQVARAGS